MPRTALCRNAAPRKMCSSRFRRSDASTPAFKNIFECPARNSFSLKPSASIVATAKAFSPTSPARLSPPPPRECLGTSAP
eukprot:605718-Pleurochrysis_carterae.AAC.1